MRLLLRAALALCFAVLALSPARSAGAQAVPDSASAVRVPAAYVYLQYGDTIGYEVVYSDTGMVRGAYIEVKKQRVHWDHELQKNQPGALVLSVFLNDTSTVVMQELLFIPRNDSLQMIMRDPSGRRTETIAVKPGTVATYSRSMTHLAYLAYFAVQAGRTSLPLFLTSSGKSVVAELEVAGETMTIAVSDLRVVSEWEGGALREVRIPSQGLVVRQLKN